MILLASLLLASVVCSAQTTKTYAVTITAPHVSLTRLPENIKIFPQLSGTRSIVEITVSANVDPHILDKLSKAGRYAFDIETLTFPNMAKAVTVNGQPLEDNVTVKVYCPK